MTHVLIECRLIMAPRDLDQIKSITQLEEALRDEPDLIQRVLSNENLVTLLHEPTPFKIDSPEEIRVALLDYISEQVMQSDRLSSQQLANIRSFGESLLKHNVERAFPLIIYAAQKGDKAAKDHLMHTTVSLKDILTFCIKFDKLFSVLIEDELSNRLTVFCEAILESLTENPSLPLGEESLTTL